MLLHIVVNGNHTDMHTVHFYEKPGCINNTKQKKLLAEAGYEVVAHDLLGEPWTKERLAEFFNGMPVAERFNRSAPRIASGELAPEAFTDEEAYQLMLEEPILIRRPLIQIGERRLVGFEQERINQAISVSWDETATGSLEACPRDKGDACNNPEK